AEVKVTMCEEAGAEFRTQDKRYRFSGATESRGPSRLRRELFVEHEAEQRAASVPIKHLDASAVALGHELDHVEAQTESLAHAALLGLHGAELLEHAGLHVGGNARASIRDLDCNRFGQPTDPHGDVPAGRRVLERVSQKGIERPADQFTVKHCRYTRREPHVQPTLPAPPNRI